MTGVALQARAVVHENDRRLAVRARQNLEEFSVECHEHVPPCGMSKNYSRKGTIERQMRKSIVVAADAVRAAQLWRSRRRNRRRQIRAGGAYYEFMMGLHLETPGRQPRRERRVPARRAARPAVGGNSGRARRAVRAPQPAGRRDRRGRARRQGEPVESRGQLDSGQPVRADVRDAATRGRPIGAPTRSARLRTSRKPIATRIPACR